MKKLLLASIVFLLSLASFGASVTLSNGAACEYSGVAIGRLGNIVVTCSGAVTAAPQPPAPTPPPPATPPGKYAAEGMWLYAQRQLRTGILGYGASASGYFVTPSGNTKVPELGISGAYLKVYLDGAEVVDGPLPAAAVPGPHQLKVVGNHEGGTAEGTVTLY